ncbi:MAG: hypothetical protein KDB90_07795 [Planctomycetes bacterium]|nr:hypothetical protein [Planctomycetota bacterium]
MKTRILLLLLAVFGVLSALNCPAPVVAQDEGGLIVNPDLYLPTGRVKDDILFKIREARQREFEAIALEREGKKEDAFEKWRDAFGRYHHLRDEWLKDDLPRNEEKLVRDDWFGELSKADKKSLDVYSETWIPLADYINSRFRIPDWPKALKDRLALQQAAKGAEMLRIALQNDDRFLLRRCARFYQFSQAGRTALQLLASQAMESADPVSAVRWLEEYQLSWADEFNRDPALQVQYVRACRDAGMNYRLGKFLRKLERSGYSADVDVGGKTVKSLDYIRAMAEAAPAVPEELVSRPGWRTLQGDGTRNAIAPPIGDFSEMLDLGPEEGVQGFKLVEKVPGTDQPQDQYSSEEPPPLPVVFPTVHESGFFVHRVAANDTDNEKLMWFRHGRESNPLQLEVPKNLRYVQRPQNNNRWGWGRQQDQRPRYRVMASTIGRLRWDLDNRESDVLFAVMGAGSPSREKTGEPTGNQIQAFDLGRDAALRVTMPNRKVEENGGDWDFLKDVVFCGAPLVRDNKLYISGAFTAKDTYEVWMFCFDVTPKGDPSKGEGKLVWRTQLCSKKLSTQPWSYGGEPVNLPDVSSVAEQGGMLYCCTHTGATAAVDRATGELCWVSRYSRERSPLPRGWFNNAPIAAGGFVVTAPYDYRLALVLDAVTGDQWMEYPNKGKGAIGEYEHVLGIVDNRLIIQGRSRLYSVGLTSFRKGGSKEADFGSLHFQAEYNTGDQPDGRGIIAGNNVLVPFDQYIAVYDVNSGKLQTKFKLDNVKPDAVPATLTIYCRGEAYKDADGLTRYKACTLTDPKTGNVFNVEHLQNGETFTFPSGEQAVVKKETFLIVASAQWVYVFKAE